jgi:ATP sulfurylase
LKWTRKVFRKTEDHHPNVRTLCCMGSVFLANRFP